MKNYFKNLQIAFLNTVLSAEPIPQDQKIDFAVGGQAVIEGVMMRSPSSISISVRKPDGKISSNSRKFQSILQKYKFLNIPLLRGVLNLVEMMIVGTQALNHSANESLGLEEEKNENKSMFSKLLDTVLFLISLAFALSISIALFKFTPLAITTYLESHSNLIKDNFFLFNLIDGIIKMSIFVFYIYILTLFKSFRRIFEYHGAEHKAIFNYESKEPLNVKNSMKQSRFHPRCGTSFIIIVFLVSIIFYSLIPRPETFLLNLLMRVTLLPVVAGISYEFLKISAKNIEKTWVKILVAPGLLFQRLTTKDPDESQMEVSLDSLENALAMEPVRS